MVEIIKYKNNRHSSKQQATNSLSFWGSLLGGAIFFVLIMFMAMPNPEYEQPPAGVKTYIDGDLKCWDKVVCCNPDDKSTCATIPICEMMN